jgi:hypothetical protein
LVTIFCRKKAIDRKWHALEANFNRAIGAQEVLARQLGIESPTPTALGQALLKHVEQASVFQFVPFLRC